MKKRLLIMIALSLLAAGAVAAWRWWPRLFAPDVLSEVYIRYEHNENIRAVFINGFRENDTVIVSVTVLEAKNDEGWALLLEDFNLTPPPQEVIDFVGKDAFAIWAAPKGDYASPMDPVKLNNDLLSVSWVDRTIRVFTIESEQQYSYILRNQLDESIKQQKKPKE